MAAPMRKALASSSRKMPVGPQAEDGISIRALKRKRSLHHYKHKQNKSNKAANLSQALEHKDETEYYFENGLRKVYPYTYYFTTYVKGRWLGKPLLEMFASEFRGTTVEEHIKTFHRKTYNAHYSKQYDCPIKPLMEEIKSGTVRVNGQTVGLDYVLGNNQLVEHKCHRHESPVLDTPIQILVDTPDILVINKPASIPCHPCGRYRHNSITFLLEREFGYQNLRNLYRLDRLTSGLLMLPKNTPINKKLEKQLEKKLLHKEYVCRVLGKFPDGEVTCDEPVMMLSRRITLYTTDPSGKPSSTAFTRISYNGKSSVVKCFPKTGRTHQIRVHLQHLGYPIVNDPLYNSTAFGPNKGKGGLKERPLEEIEKIIMNTSNVGNWITGRNPDYVARFGEDGLKQCPHDTVPVEGDIEDDVVLVKDDNTAMASDIAHMEEDITLVKGDIADSKGENAGIKVDIVNIKGENAGIKDKGDNGDIKGSNTGIEVYNADIKGDNVNVQGDIPTMEADSGTTRRDIDQMAVDLADTASENVCDITGNKTDRVDKAASARSENTNVNTDIQDVKRRKLDIPTSSGEADIPPSDRQASLTNQDGITNNGTIASESLNKQTESKSSVPDSDITSNADFIDTDPSNESMEVKDSVCKSDSAGDGKSGAAGRADLGQAGASVNMGEGDIGESSDKLTRNTGVDMSEDDPSVSSGQVATNTSVSVRESTESKRLGLERRKMTVNRHCAMCKHIYQDPEPREMLIYLHALCYKGPDWEYSTDLPYWADPDFTDEDIREH